MPLSINLPTCRAIENRSGEVALWRRMLVKRLGGQEPSSVRSATRKFASRKDVRFHDVRTGTPPSTSELTSLGARSLSGITPGLSRGLASRGRVVENGQVAGRTGVPIGQARRADPVKAEGRVRGHPGRPHQSAAHLGRAGRDPVADNYRSTNLANMRWGSMAINVPLLRARTSPFWFTISATLMCLRPDTRNSRDSTRRGLFRGTGFR